MKKADPLQVKLGEGPCLSAMQGGDHFLIDNTMTDQRWPRWCPAVADLGVRSVISVWLSNGTDKPVGSLLLHRHRSGHRCPHDPLSTHGRTGLRRAHPLLPARQRQAARRRRPSRQGPWTAAGIGIRRQRITAYGLRHQARQRTGAVCSSPARNVGRVFGFPEC